MTFKENLKQLRLFFLGIDPFLTPFYYRNIYKPQIGSIAEIIDQNAQGNKNFKFLQIGGNDGFVKDPIFKFVKRHRWQGIIVEPQYEVFHKRLSKTYRFEKRVKLENKAVAEKSGTRSLYKLSISDSRWATGLATFNKDVLLGQIARNYVDDRAKREGAKTPDNPESYITEEMVQCVAIHDVLADNGYSSIDLLQIDTEGFDYEIIKSINFELIKPEMISFEHEHLNESDYSACMNLLEGQGYALKHVERDTLASLN